MRIGFMGPRGGLVESLRPLIEFFLETLRVETIIYLGDDGALEQYRLEHRLAVLGPTPEADPWDRTRNCLYADADAVDAQVSRERQIGKLMRLQSLPEERMAQVALTGGGRLLACFERGQLPKKAMADAQLVVFGKADVPVVDQVGPQFLVSPGPLSKAGVMVLDDSQPSLRLALFDRVGRQIAQHHLTDYMQTPGRTRRGLA